MNDLEPQRIREAARAFRAHEYITGKNTDSLVMNR